jgi:hypothetical protein
VGKVRVPVRTLDAIFDEAGIKQIDFISIDVEGMELDVLRGLSSERFQPKLILLEDFFYNHTKHRFIRKRGYKLVRRTGFNNWYVPQNAPYSVFSVSTRSELFRLFRKMWIAPPFNNFRRIMRERRFAQKNAAASKKI